MKTGYYDDALLEELHHFAFVNTNTNSSDAGPRAWTSPPSELSPPDLPLLITGIAGVAGYCAFQYFHRLYPGQVVGTRRKDNWKFTGPGIEDCDAGDVTRLEELFDQYDFQSVLNAEGHCKLKSCELDPVLAHRANVTGAMALTRVIKTRPVRLIHLSIDLVYSGLAGAPYSESDPPDPVTVYGQTMWETEQRLSDRVPCTILRISLPMGHSFNGHAGAIDWIVSRFKNDRPATLYYDEIRTPQYADCLSRLCHDLLGRDLLGTFHAGGPRPLSLFQIAQVINRVGGYSPDLLHGCARTDAGPVPPRAGDVRLNSNRLQNQLGYPPFLPWPLATESVPTNRDWHRERQDHQLGSFADLQRQLCHLDADAPADQPTHCN